MAAGLQVFDASGGLRTDLGDRVLRFLGTIVVGPGPASGVVINDGFLTGTPFWFSSMHANNPSSFWPGEGLLAADVSFSGNVMSWSLPSGRPTTRIQYGVW
ncbi:MAG: hypothetical protein DI527_01070 [Chelatococcus sp.]|nr:MAG: hypothetical protein DI527_01070 [Chelatococcus sp.]